MKTTVKVGLPPAEDIDSTTLTRIVLPKKRAKSPPLQATRISIKARLSEDLDGQKALTAAHGTAEKLLDARNGEYGAEISSEGKPRKRRETSVDDEARQTIINKILNESSKKLKKKVGEDGSGEVKKEGRHHTRLRPDPPCIKYTSKPDFSFLTLPSAIDIRQLLRCEPTKPRKTPDPCACGKPGKYRDPASLLTYCSVGCFRLIKER